jgi:hypothetical protein
VTEPWRRGDAEGALQAVQAIHAVHAVHAVQAVHVVQAALHALAYYAQHMFELPSSDKGRCVQRSLVDTRPEHYGKAQFKRPNTQCLGHS